MLIFLQLLPTASATALALVAAILAVNVATSFALAVATFLLLLVLLLLSHCNVLPSDGYESKNYESNLVESARLRIESNRISNRIQVLSMQLNSKSFPAFLCFYFHLLNTDNPEGLLLKNKKNIFSCIFFQNFNNFFLFPYF